MNKKSCEMISHPLASFCPMTHPSPWDNFREKDSHNRYIKKDFSDYSGFKNLTC